MDYTTGIASTLQLKSFTVGKEWIVAGGEWAEKWDCSIEKTFGTKQN